MHRRREEKRGRLVSISCALDSKRRNDISCILLPIVSSEPINGQLLCLYTFFVHFCLRVFHTLNSTLSPLSLETWKTAIVKFETITNKFETWTNLGLFQVSTIKICRSFYSNSFLHSVAKWRYFSSSKSYDIRFEDWSLSQKLLYDLFTPIMELRVSDENEYNNENVKVATKKSHVKFSKFSN